MSRFELDSDTRLSVSGTLASTLWESEGDAELSLAHRLDRERNERLLATLRLVMRTSRRYAPRGVLRLDLRLDLDLIAPEELQRRVQRRMQRRGHRITREECSTRHRLVHWRAIRCTARHRLNAVAIRSQGTGSLCWSRRRTGSLALGCLMSRVHPSLLHPSLLLATAAAEPPRRRGASCASETRCADQGHDRRPAYPPQERCCRLGAAWRRRCHRRNVAPFGRRLGAFGGVGSCASSCASGCASGCVSAPGPF